MYPRRMMVFMTLVEAVGLALLVHTLIGGLAWVTWNTGLFFIMVVATSLFAIKLPRGNGMVTVSMPVIVASAVILGPSAGLWLGLLGTMTQRELSGQVKWPSTLFNRAQYGIVGWAAGAAFAVAGGSLRHFVYEREMLPIAIACLVAYVGNTALVASAISLRQHQNLYRIWRGYMSWSTLNYFVMMPMVFLMIVVYRIGGAWPELICLVPLALSRWIYILLIRVRKFYDMSVRAMLIGLEAKDQYTFGHSMRVGHYAGMLARHMGLSEDRVDLVIEAGRLHDIGKIDVPDAILKKPASLSPEETASMQRHPVVGGELLESLDLIGCAKKGARLHHERWDGEGYPYRLKGQDIPLETRIVSVVDTYDAMTSNRTYRPSLGHEAAMQEIVRVSGQQFDPEVVNAFIDMVKDTNLAETEGAKFDMRRRPGSGRDYHPS